MKDNKRAGLISGVAVIFIVIAIILMVLTHWSYEDNQPTEFGCNLFKPEFNTSEHRSCFTIHWESYCQEIAPQDCQDYDPDANEEYNKIK